MVKGFMNWLCQLKYLPNIQDPCSGGSLAEGLQATGDEEYLSAAYDAGKALAWGKGLKVAGTTLLMWHICIHTKQKSSAKVATVHLMTILHREHSYT